MKNEGGIADHLLTTPLAPKEVPGWMLPVVYFVGPELKCGSLVKIGTTGDIAGRFSGLRLSSPLPLLLHSVVSGDCVLERELHREFAKYRQHGEWFRITPTLRDRILAFRDIFEANLAGTRVVKTGTRVRIAYNRMQCGLAQTVAS